MKKIVPLILLLTLIPLTTLYSRESELMALNERLLRNGPTRGLPFTVQFDNSFVSPTEDYSRLEDFASESVPLFFNQYQEQQREKNKGFYVLDFVRDLREWSLSLIPLDCDFDSNTNTLWIKAFKMFGLPNVSYGTTFTNDNLLKPNHVGTIVKGATLRYVFSIAPRDDRN